MNIKLSQPQAIHQLGKRKNQEDTIYPRLGKATVSDRVFLVCDGMGGHEKGEVASLTVATAIASYLKKNFNPEEQALPDQLLQDAIVEAYKGLDERDDGSFKKMGTTLTLVVLHRGGATVAHIGDSRIYHLRPATGEVLYKSRDHSLVYELYQAGEISYSEMKTSPQKNVITRAMMPGEDSRTKADIVHITDIKAGDYFYHCSDGMLEQMEDDEIMEIFASELTDEQKAQRLIDATAENSDNHSAYLIHIEQVESEPDDATQPNDEATAHCNAVRIERERGKDDIEVIEDDEATQAIATPPTPPPFHPNGDSNDDSDGLSPADEPADKAMAATPAEPKPRRQGRGVPDGFDPNGMPPAPERSRISKKPIVIGILCLLALAALAVWKFYPKLFSGKPAEKPKTESSASISSIVHETKEELKEVTEEDNTPAQEASKPLKVETIKKPNDKKGKQNNPQDFNIEKNTTKAVRSKAGATAQGDDKPREPKESAVKPNNNQSQSDESNKTFRTVN